MLHIGNVANNAYLNAKILNKAGLDCDVLCYDYYHIMGCPQWEDVDFEGDVGDQFAPNWDGIDLKGFVRPDWFAQETFLFAAHYLIARRTNSRLQQAFWGWLQGRRTLRSVANKLRLPRLWSLCRKATWPVRRLHGLLIHSWPAVTVYKDLAQAFVESFPDRQDTLCRRDVNGYMNPYALWKKLFACYDAVVGYSTDGAYALTAGKRPYFAYEHGTIRSIPFEATAQGRMCALTYKLADGCFITNCDNIVAAGKLGLDNYRFVPHPVNEDLNVAGGAGTLRAELCRRLDSDFLVFHPSRQHWEPRRHPAWEKGNDIFIRGFARFVQINPRAGAVFVDWGQTVGQSKALLESLGVAGRVIWVKPLPNAKMIAHIRACDMLADQFFLGAFGSTMPKALLHGRPAMLYLDCERHKWCFPEMPPVINARDDQQVFDGLVRLYRDGDYRRQLIDDGLAWYRKYHSNAVIVRTFMEAFGGVLR